MESRGHLINPWGGRGGFSEEKLSPEPGSASQAAGPASAEAQRQK